VETTNYRMARLPTGMELPVYVKEEFPQFYRAMFSHQVEREDMRAVFLEYAWDMGWCDPCAADPLSMQELRKLGVFWLPASDVDERLRRRLPGGAADVFVTRLHVFGTMPRTSPKTSSSRRPATAAISRVATSCGIRGRARRPARRRSVTASRCARAWSGRPGRWRH
jgi:hypothetical protein